ncbi:flagellar biosynthetic protein FliR [Paenibacillus doosanensis]|uniref:Flagellar biosynthetic protein FliR n=1 Tax=Paenibacillus konkukensis TaxID=2020716 RepID=A0ABY4S0B0_9BACL|nr:MULTISPECIES: flagellar biosynthetic protein FliR [Paenibacillus]MCS7461881.1 flagellar biosynthetic protein FliR [Paenibacillus doosanensis]UQZ87350.1 Flagellar biosynthetic protein FliR [Paenibacillus konkukensis]
MEWLTQYLPGFMLFFCRITSFFVVVPVFSAKNVPQSFKIGLSFFITLMAFPLFGMSSPISFDSLYLLSVFREILVGLLLGFVAYLFFTIVQVAGALIDMQMGFGLANVIDPMTGAQSPILGNLKYVLAMLLFLSFNGHHLLLKAIMESYEWIPLSNELFAKMYSGQIAEFLVKTFSSVFTLSFQMAAPLIVAFFLTDVGLGFLARVAPQFNIFVVGMPLKILVGFMLLILLFPGYEFVYKDMFTAMLDAMQKFIGLFQT